MCSPQSSLPSLPFFSLHCVGTGWATSTCGMDRSLLAPGSIHMQMENLVNQREAAFFRSRLRRWAYPSSPKNQNARPTHAVIARRGWTHSLVLTRTQASRPEIRNPHGILSLCLRNQSQRGRDQVDRHAPTPTGLTWRMEG